MAKQALNYGTADNDGTGDSLRSGAQKINNNFTEIYNALGGENGAPLTIVNKLEGTGIIVSSPSGEVTLSLKPATNSTLGGVIAGEGVAIDETGTITAQVYELPVASETILGGIKVGTNLSISNGVLSASLNAYTLPTASPSQKGGIKVGTGLEMTEAGFLNTTPPNLPAATAEDNGVVRIGSGLSVDETGLLTLDPITFPDAPTSLINGDYEFTLTSVGTLTLPNSSEIHSNINGSVDITAGPGVDTTAGLSSNNGNSWMWVDPQGAYISTEGANYNQWTFNDDGSTTFPGLVNLPAQANFQFENDDIIQIFADATGGTIAGQTNKVIQITTQNESLEGFTWKFDEQGRFIFPDTSVQESAAISLVDLKTLVADSTSFEDFQSRIAAL